MFTTFYKVTNLVTRHYTSQQRYASRRPKATPRLDVAPLNLSLSTPILLLIALSPNVNTVMVLEAICFAAETRPRRLSRTRLIISENVGVYNGVNLRRPE